MPPEIQTKFSKQLIVHILERSTNRANMEMSIEALARGKAAPAGGELAKMLREAFGDDVAQSLTKVKMILGDEVFQVLNGSWCV